MFRVNHLVAFHVRSTSSAKLGGQAMARRRVFVRCKEIAFLEDAARWRQQCISVLTRAKPQGALYKAVEGVLGAIASLAEVVAGDRKRFHQQSPHSPGPDLAPLKWRTVE
jgi:hypothetical protein